MILPETVLKAVVARLDDPEEHVRFAAASTLRNQALLSKRILEAVVVVRLEGPSALLGWNERELSAQ